MIVNFICNQIVAHFGIAKGHLRCCLYTFWNVSPVGIRNGFHRRIHSAIKMIGREKGHNATRENAERSVACVHKLSYNQVTFKKKFIGIVLDSDVWKHWRVQIHVSFLVQWEVSVCTRRSLRSSAHRRIPNTHSMTSLDESHGATQIEVPNDGNTKNGSLRGKIFRWHQKTGA